MNLSDPDSTGRSSTPPSERKTSGSSGGESGSRKGHSRSRKSGSRNSGARKTSGVNQSTTPNPVEDATIVPNSRSSADHSGKSMVGEASPQPVSDRYLSLGEVGRGGWGVVEKVIDRQLDREVAVKRLTDCSEVTEQDRQRFLHEAKVTSQLQHPGIVPVHELGDRRDAFYVMKLLEGTTFQECIESHHLEASSDSKPTRFQYGQSLEPLLQRFVDICNAVAYAHQRGVIHRDLKPSNVMVSGFGETVVLDWGLATSAERNVASDQPKNLKGRRSPSAQVSSLLEPNGTVIGTPSYMSPEQAAGKINDIRCASDIYSLGIILYTIIAGRHPYQGLQLNEVLEQVKAASFPSLASLQPRTPKPLLAIVDKATARIQSDRYGNAEQLANDVRRFIAGESVSVHREGPVERGMRWCRHHQGIAATVSASVLFLLIASVGFGLVIKQAHRAEKASRIAAQEAHQEAVASLAEAREATDTWLVELSGSLQFYPGMEPLRTELLDRAMAQYSRIAQQNLTTEKHWHASHQSRGDAQFEARDQRIETLAILEQAKASLRLGDLCRLAGKTAEASRHYDSTEQLLQSFEPEASPIEIRCVSAESTPNIDFNKGGTIRQRLVLERINALIGQRLVNAGVTNQPDAEIQIEKARQWLLRLVEPMMNGTKSGQVPQLDSFSRRLASAYVRLEVSVDENYQQAIQVSRWLAKTGNTVSDRRLSETVQTAQCQRLTNAGMIEAADERWSVLIEDLRSWLAQSPSRIDYRQSLAHAMLQRGNCRVELARHDAARSDFENAIETLRQAWRMTDDDGFYRTNLATAENNLGHLLFTENMGDRALAGDLLNQSLQIYESLLRENVTGERLRRYAQTHYALSSLEDDPASGLSPLLADHARKAASGFEILKDYQSLTVADLLAWIRCEIRLSADGATDAGSLAKSKLPLIQSIRNQINTDSLNNRQQDELQQIDRSIAEIEKEVSSGSNR